MLLQRQSHYLYAKCRNMRFIFWQNKYTSRLQMNAVSMWKNISVSQQDRAEVSADLVSVIIWFHLSCLTYIFGNLLYTIVCKTCMERWNPRNWGKKNGDTSRRESQNSDPEAHVHKHSWDFSVTLIQHIVVLKCDKSNSRLQDMTRPKQENSWSQKKGDHFNMSKARMMRGERNLKGRGQQALCSS